MRIIDWFAISLATIAFPKCGGEYHTPLCVQLSSSRPIVARDVQPATNATVDGNFYFYYDPLILPFTIRYTPGKGVSIISKNLADAALITPIGLVGTSYTVNTKTARSINGIPITGGDYVIGIVNRKKNEKQLYKIEGYSRLKIVTNGRTKIEAQNGYVELDITDAEVEEFKFIDDARISLVNTTDKPVSFFFGLHDMSGITAWSDCDIEPHSYKNYPAADIIKSMNEMVNTDYFFKIEANQVNQDESSSQTIKVSLGDVCRIVTAADGKALKLEKNTEPPQ